MQLKNVFLEKFVINRSMTCSDARSNIRKLNRSTPSIFRNLNPHCIVCTQLTLQYKLFKNASCHAHTLKVNCGENENLILSRKPQYVNSILIKFILNLFQKLKIKLDYFTKTSFHLPRIQYANEYQIPWKIHVLF